MHEPPPHLSSLSHARPHCCCHSKESPPPFFVSLSLRVLSGRMVAGGGGALLPLALGCLLVGKVEVRGCRVPLSSDAPGFWPFPTQKITMGLQEELGTCHFHPHPHIHTTPPGSGLGPQGLFSPDRHSGKGAASWSEAACGPGGLALWRAGRHSSGQEGHWKCGYKGHRWHWVEESPFATAPLPISVHARGISVLGHRELTSPTERLPFNPEESIPCARCPSILLEGKGQGDT